MIAGIVCALAAGFALVFALTLRRRLQNLTDMLDAALRGEFQPERFDESLTSSVESKLRTASRPRHYRRRR